MINPEQVDAWCCEPTYYGQPCEYPADYEVIYGVAPDEVTLLCEGHLKELWEPHWEPIPLTNEQRLSYSLSWGEWTKDNNDVKGSELKCP